MGILLGVDVLPKMRYNTFTQTQKDFKMFTNCIARAKLNYNKKLKTYKLLVAFCNANESITQRNSAFVSGDLSAETIASDLPRVLAQAQATLRTNNIQIAE
jgi:hypothetical protein